MSISIAAAELTRFFDDRRAVEDVSFEVAPGEVLGLLGPNGAGKTTLLRMLAGVLVPTRGTAHILGFDVQKHPLEARARLGFISGDTALYGRLTVKEMLTYFGELYGLERPRLAERIADLTPKFGLTDIIDRKTEALSSGQKQRANLARAFISDPEVLILDEPTTALDVISGRFVYDAVRRAKHEQKSILLSTHIMSEASDLCDRIALLVNGRLVDTGTEAELLERGEARSLSELIIRLHEVGA